MASSLGAVTLMSNTLVISTHIFRIAQLVEKTRRKPKNLCYFAIPLYIVPRVTKVLT